MRCSTIQLIHVCRNWEPDPLLQLPKEAQPRTLDFAFHYDLKAVDSSCTYFFSTMSSYPSISLSCPILHIQAAGGCSKPRTQDGKVTNSELLQLDATSASGRIKGSSSHLSDLQQPSSHRLAGAWDRILLSLVGFVVQVLGSILSPSQCLLSTTPGSQWQANTYCGIGGIFSSSESELLPTLQSQVDFDLDPVSSSIYKFCAKSNIAFPGMCLIYLSL